ncbi:hypothetical protein Dimus_022699 [Dionaea muscipula]
MKLAKDEKYYQRLVRAIKTVFFLLTLLVSFLVFSAAPVFLAIADTILPSALVVSASSISPPFLSLQSLLSHLANYDFRYSIIDIPLVSCVRSIIILCVYSCCDGPGKSRGPYLGAATLCSVVSLVFVSVKASLVFGGNNLTEMVGGGGGRTEYGRGVELALFVCSYVLAVGHVVVAYRISCRERKKLLVYKIDIEAVSACNNGYPRYQKVLLQEERRK